MVVSQKKEEENLKVLMDSLRGETQELQDEKEVHEKELIGLKKVVNETKSKVGF